MLIYYTSNSGLQNGNRKKFPVYEMETGKISVLRNLNWKFYSLRFT